MKEWLWLSFFPQEDPAQLNVLRSNLTPFLKSVTKALSYELEFIIFGTEQTKAVFDEILDKLPAENSATSFCTNLNQTSNTLQFEFDQLLNLQ